MGTFEIRFSDKEDFGRKGLFGVNAFLNLDFYIYGHKKRAFAL
jgi:hypothetical protein